MPWGPDADSAAHDKPSHGLQPARFAAAYRVIGTMPAAARFGRVFVSAGCLLWFLVFASWLPTAQLAAQDARPQQPSSKGDRSHGGAPVRQIAHLIENLSHPSFDVRSAATLKLCTYPLAARAPLQRAARGDDAERALRARAVLSLLDQIAFTGVDIALAFSKDVVAWDQPVDLLLTLHNTSDHPATIPFQLDEISRDGLDPNARQVGDMLDLSEWLTLRGADGKIVELHIDDISQEAAVAHAVQERIDRDIQSTLGPGKTVLLNIVAFNRGWARYPLLKKGRYAATLRYLPSWQNERFIRAAVGSAESNTATVSVSHSAPPGVSASASPATLNLVPREKRLTAVLTNRNDLPWFVNTSFGRPAKPSARGHWSLTVGNDTIIIPAVAQPVQDPHGSTSEKLVRVQPGASLDVFSIPIEHLRDQANAASGSDFAIWSVTATYDNFQDSRRSSPNPTVVQDGTAPRPPGSPVGVRRRVLYTHLRSPEWKSTNLSPAIPGHP
ncbi:MAG: hypothetical protein ACE5E5_01040 [Phycisphaerae bacterium]